MNYPSRSVWLCVLYVALHVAAQLSARWFEIAPGISVWYPPSGLALSLLWLLGPRYSPVVFGANVLAALLMPGLPLWWAPILFPALITANYALIAWLARRLVGENLFQGRITSIVQFIVISLCAPIGSAAVGTWVADISGAYHPPSVPVAILRWWLGDVSGVLTVLPVAMVFGLPWLKGKVTHRPRDRRGWRLVLSAVGPAGALLGSLWLAFARPDVLPYGTLYICFLPLCWVSLRYGLRGATLASLILTVGCLVGLHHAPQSDRYWISFILFQLAVTVLGLGLGSAVSRRNDAVNELTVSRARFDRVIAGAQLGLWDWNLVTGEVAYNDRCAELLGRPLPQLAPGLEAWEQAMHIDDRPRHRELLQTHLRGASPLYEFEYRIRTDDGHWRWIQSRGSVVRRDEFGAPRLVSGTHADVTERKAAEAAARRLLTIVETTTDFIFSINAEGRIVYANRSFLRLLDRRGERSVDNQSYASILPSFAAEKLRSEIIPAVQAEGSWQGELSLSEPDYEPLITSAAASLHEASDNAESLISVVLRDITQQKQNEAANLERERRLLQVQKAESLGVLAGGVAHDFNNLLTAISGNASLLREEFPVVDQPNGSIANIELAATRAAELCRNMLAYAGRVRLTLSDVDVNALVLESRELVHAAVSRKIVLDTSLAPNLPKIRACASQLQQIIINLALNASDAIGDRRGTIRFRTSQHELSAADMDRLLDTPSLAPGRYVFLDVEDDGPGIPETLLEKIFEPFFTTKPKGHGLGLSAVNGIVRAHGGAVRVQSAVGVGSTFRVALPVPVVTAAPAVAAPRAGSTWKGSGIALIVDDEDMVRNVVARLLERMGFTTTTARDGVEAVELFQERNQELRVVLTDLSMPRMNGDEALVAMRRINPDIPVVLMSGYPEKLSPDHFSQAQPAALLAKPLRYDVLQSTLAQVLGEARASENGVGGDHAREVACR